MKTVFKNSLLVLFLAFTTSINSQKSVNVTSTIIPSNETTSTSTPKLALQAGYVNQIRYGSQVSSTYFNGGRLGVTANYSLKNNFSFLTGVLYSVVYSDKKQGYSNLNYVKYYTLSHSVDIPLQAIYHLPLSKTFKMFAFAGPTINLGLSQLQQITSTQTYLPTNPLYVEPKTIDFYKESLLNRLNLQVGVGGGVQWKNYQLKSGYDFGINNLNKLDTGNQYQKGWYATFSYEF